MVVLGYNAFTFELTIKSISIDVAKVDHGIPKM